MLHLVSRGPANPKVRGQRVPNRRSRLAGKASRDAADANSCLSATARPRPWSADPRPVCSARLLPRRSADLGAGFNYERSIK